MFDEQLCPRCYVRRHCACTKEETKGNLLVRVYTEEEKQVVRDRVARKLKQWEDMDIFLDGDIDNKQYYKRLLEAGETPSRVYDEEPYGEYELLNSEGCNVTFGHLTLHEISLLEPVLMQPVNRKSAPQGNSSRLYATLHYAMLTAYQQDEHVLTRAREAYDKMLYWLIDYKFTLRQVHTVAKLIGRNLVAQWIENKSSEYNLDQPIYRTLKLLEQKELIHLINASMIEFRAFLIAMHVAPHKLAEYESLQSEAVKTLYYFVHEHPNRPLQYIIHVANDSYMLNSFRDLHVLRPVYDIIRVRALRKEEEEDKEASREVEIEEEAMNNEHNNIY